jgi:hypothetical protein
MRPGGTSVRSTEDGAARGERIAVFVVATLLVLFRSLPFALYEQIQFDSDQAIFGLMALQISTGRALPLFMYGNAYLLAVEAWLAAPWFLIAPPSLATLSIPLIIINVATALLMIHALERSGLRPLYALLASMFFLLAPPIVAGDLMSASGGNVEPFLYIVLLWLLRDRPMWFGATLALGFLQREFAVYAVPVLLLGELIAGRLLTRAAVRKWMIAMVTGLAVWQGVQALQPFADLMGPGTRGDLLHGFSASQIGNLSNQVDLSPALLGPRLAAFVRIHLPRLLGATYYRERLPQQRPGMALLLLAALLIALLRLGVVVWRSWRVKGSLGRSGAFGWYLLGVGLVASAAYAGTRPVAEEYARYGLLGLLIPSGTFALLFMLDTPAWRKAAASMVLVWAVSSAIEAGRLYGHAGAAPSPYRVLADELLARGVRVATAPYWTAYVVTFMTGERVKVASTDYVRILEYQTLAADPATVAIREQPCEGATRIARWYLCRNQ